VKIFKENMRHFFGGCPKRNVCSFRQSEGKTCIYGPYQYCGKYRSVIKTKKPHSITTLRAAFERLNVPT